MACFKGVAACAAREKIFDHSERLAVKQRTHARSDGAPDEQFAVSTSSSPEERSGHFPRSEWRFRVGCVFFERVRNGKFKGVTDKLKMKVKSNLKIMKRI